MNTDVSVMVSVILYTAMHMSNVYTIYMFCS